MTTKQTFWDNISADNHGSSMEMEGNNVVYEPQRKIAYSKRHKLLVINRSLYYLENETIYQLFISFSNN